MIDLQAKSNDEFQLTECVHVVEPVMCHGDGHTEMLLPGEDLYVVGLPTEEGTLPRYLVRCPATGVQSKVAYSLLVAAPTGGMTWQKALQMARLSQTTLMGTVSELLQRAEREGVDQATKEAAREHGPAFINIVFVGEPHALEFVEIEDDDGKGIRVGEWRDRDAYRILRIPYGGGGEK